MTRIIEDTKLDFSDVLIRPSWSPTPSRANVLIEREFQFFHSPKIWKGFPLMVANMDTTGTFAMAEVFRQEKSIVCLHKHYSLEDLVKYYSGLSIQSAQQNPEDYVWYALGISDKDIEKLKNLLAEVEGLQNRINLCIDIANGYSHKFISKCEEIRNICPDAIIMAGNICTEDTISDLIFYGKVDIVKVGIGPGSSCTTRLKTGVGYPQLSAALECANKAHGLKNVDRRMGLICSDGGCTTPGDICKAFGAGSDFVMTGGMFAGTDECDGEWEYEIDYNKTPWVSYTDGLKWNYTDNKKSLKFYGMSSYEAQDKHQGRQEYRGSEGKCVVVPYKGPAIDTLGEIKAGVRSCCSYIGSTSIKDLAKCTTFVKVNRTHNKVFGE